MNRWDWMRGVMGISGADKAELTGDEILLAVREGFDAIASALQRFELEISDKFDRARREFKEYAESSTAKIRSLEIRLKNLEEVFFELDHQIAEQQLLVARHDIAAQNEFKESDK